MSEKNRRRIVELEDESGIIFPQTHISAVIDSNRKPLNEILENIQAGNVDLTGIREAISELQNQIFPLSSSLSTKSTNGSNKSIWEYTGSRNSSYTGYLVNSITFKGDSSDIRNSISSFNINSSSSNFIIENHNHAPREVYFSFSASDNFYKSYYESYTLTLKVILKDLRETTSSCSVSLVAPSWIGWAPNSELNGSWLNRTSLNELVSDKYMIRKTSTDLAGDYNYESVPKGYSFWTIVPVSTKYTGHSEVYTSNFPVAMKEMAESTTIIDMYGITYRCRRNDSGGLATGDQPWRMTLKNG